MPSRTDASQDILFQAQFTTRNKSYKIVSSQEGHSWLCFGKKKSRLDCTSVVEHVCCTHTIPVSIPKCSWERPLKPQKVIAHLDGPIQNKTSSCVQVWNECAHYYHCIWDWVTSRNAPGCAVGLIGMGNM